MKYRLLILTFLLAGNLVAQTPAEVNLKVQAVSGDTINVALDLGTAGDSLSVPIWAFEFVVSSDSLVQFIAVDSKFTLSEKQGWTTAGNPARKWVGGFASSRDAIETGGTLVTFDLLIPDGANGSALCLQRLRLNSGDPTPIPTAPCIEAYKTPVSEE